MIREMVKQILEQQGFDEISIKRAWRNMESYEQDELMELSDLKAAERIKEHME